MTVCTLDLLLIPCYLNIEIDREHRDFVRFLWVKDPKKGSPEVMVLRFARVLFGVNSSLFILNATVGNHLNTRLPVHSALAREQLKLMTTFLDMVAWMVRSHCLRKNSFVLSQEASIWENGVAIQKI